MKMMQIAVQSKVNGANIMKKEIKSTAKGEIHAALGLQVNEKTNLLHFLIFIWFW